MIEYKGIVWVWVNMSEFPVTLVSSTRVEGNRTDAFTVRLPRRLQFESNWAVALKESQVPHTWSGWSSADPLTLDIYSSFHPAMPNTVRMLRWTILPMHHSTAGELAKALNTIIRTTDWRSVQRRDREYARVQTEESDKFYEAVQKNPKLEH